MLFLYSHMSWNNHLHVSSYAELLTHQPFAFSPLSSSRHWICPCQSHQMTLSLNPMESRALFLLHLFAASDHVDTIPSLHISDCSFSDSWRCFFHITARDGRRIYCIFSSAHIHALLSHWTSLTKYQFKDKTIKKCKVATSEHNTKGGALLSAGPCGAAQVNCPWNWPWKQHWRQEDKEGSIIIKVREDGGWD